MKLLVIGIDGGTKEIIMAMNMPFLQDRLKEGINLDIEEDLWSRGWAEILNGHHGHDTGAFYYKPVLGSPGDTSSHFGTENHEGKDINPLWRTLNNRGCKVGFMNLPTTMPAPKVDGFFISGAGAGFNPKYGLKPPACYPNEAFDYLLKIGYPWQVRFMASEIKEIIKFVGAIEASIDKRGQAFSFFCDKFNPDFGFLTHTENTPIQNVAMVEIKGLIENDCIPKNIFQEKIYHFYSYLDNSIKSTVKNIQPENLIIVSDHGASPRLSSVNLNQFLQDIGMQGKKQISSSGLKKFTKKASIILPKRLKQIGKRLAPEMVKELYSPNIDWPKTQAFGQRYIPGIYINDRIRFGGPVDSEEEIDHLTQYIINKFNLTEIAIKNDLHARPYRREYSFARFNDLLPDVWVESPDPVFFEGDGPFFETNRDYHFIESLRDVTRDLFTGIKGRRPIACIDKKLENCIDPNDPSDLTQIYQIINRAMKC